MFKSDNASSITEELKDVSQKLNLSKFECDLYNAEDDVTEKIIRVKRICLSNKEERWKIYEDNKSVFVLEGNKLSKKEKSFLHSVEGINWLLSRAKSGIKSFNSLKINLKQKMKSSP